MNQPFHFLLFCEFPPQNHHFLQKVWYNIDVDNEKELRTMPKNFQKDDYVFYESGGICKILDIQIAPLEGMPADREYYVMRSIYDKSGMI